MHRKKIIGLIIAGVLLGIGLSCIPHTETATPGSSLTTLRIGPSFALENKDPLAALCMGINMPSDFQAYDQDSGLPFVALMQNKTICQAPGIQGNMYPVAIVLNIVTALLVVFGVNTMINKIRKGHHVR
jgi:hypothetical protein